MSCQECKHWNVYKGCRERVCKYEPKDEPQTNKVVEKKPTPIRDYMVNGKANEPQTDDLQDWKDRMWAEAIVTEPQTDVYDYKGNGKWERSE